MVGVETRRIFAVVERFPEVVSRVLVVVEAAVFVVGATKSGFYSDKLLDERSNFRVICCICGIRCCIF